MATRQRSTGIWFPSDSSLERGYELTLPRVVGGEFSCSHDIALWMALCSRVSYAEQADATRMLRAAGFDDFRFIPPAGTHAYIAVHRGGGDPFAVLAFRGTTTIEDFLTDARVRLRAVRGLPGARGHSGFQEALDSVWEQIAAALQDMRNRHGALPLYLTGHSLGAAQSLLAAQRLRSARDLSSPVFVVNLGCPRVGDTHLREGLVAAAPIHRIVHASDTIPRVPPLLFGYRHAGVEHWLLADGRDKVFPHHPSLAQRVQWVNLAYGQSYAFRQYLGISLVLALLLTTAIYKGLGIEAGLGVGGALLLGALLWAAIVGALLLVADALPARVRRWVRPHAVIDHGSDLYVEALAARANTVLTPRPLS